MPRKIRERKQRRTLKVKTTPKTPIAKTPVPTPVPTPRPVAPVLKPKTTPAPSSESLTPITKESKTKTPTPKPRPVAKTSLPKTSLPKTSVTKTITKTPTRAKTKTKTKTKGKRPVGRPKTKPNPESIPLRGILLAPDDKDNHVEFLYNHPSDFQKINTYFSHLKSDVLTFKFGPAGISIYATDHLESNKCRIILNGAKAASYFCVTPVTIKVKRTNLDLVLQTLNRQYVSVSIILRTIDMNEKMYIMLKNDIQIATFSITIIHNYDAETDISDDVFVESLQPKIELNIRGKFLQFLFVSMKKFSDCATFQKIGRDGEFEVTYTFQTAQSQVNANLRLKKTEQITKESDIQHTLTEDEYFTVSVYRTTLHPISVSNIAELIHFRFWRDKSILCTASLNDGAVVFDIRVAIINFRRTA